MACKWALVTEPKNANANGTRDSNQDTQVGSELVDIGINYTGKFSNMKVAVGGSYYTSNTEAAAGAAAAADVDGHSVSAQVSANGVRVGGRYTRHQDIGGAGLDRTNWRVGADYSMGALGLGITYQVAAQDRTSSTEDASTYLSVGSSYNLSPGVQMYGGVLFVTYDDDGGAAANEGDNSFGVLGTKLSF